MRHVAEHFDFIVQHHNRRTLKITYQAQFSNGTISPIDDIMLLPSTWELLQCR